MLSFYCHCRIKRMYHQRIRTEIESIAPLDALERTHQLDALLWVNSGVGLNRLVKPATPPKHLVSYFAVVNDTSILLVDHIIAQRWLPSGGHVEPDEHPRETVVRELLEELGFSPQHDIGPPLLISSTETVGDVAKHIDVSLWYVVRAEETQEIEFDDSEFRTVQWFKFSDVPFERSDPHLRRFIEKLLAA